MRTYTNKETQEQLRVQPGDLLPIDYIPDDYYSRIHKYMVIPCIDIFVKYNNSILLVKRKNEPAKGQYWCFGGRLLRGINELDNVYMIIKKESNLDVVGVIHLLGIARTMFKESPYNHKKGTDSRNTVYLVTAVGSLKLDDLHKDILFFSYDDFVNKLHHNFNPYIKDNLEKIFNEGFFY